MQFSSRTTIAVHILLCTVLFEKDYKITSDFLAGSVNVNPVIIRKTEKVGPFECPVRHRRRNAGKGAKEHHLAGRILRHGERGRGAVPFPRAAQSGLPRGAERSPGAGSETGSGKKSPGGQPPGHDPAGYAGRSQAICRRGSIMGDSRCGTDCDA